MASDGTHRVWRWLAIDGSRLVVAGLVLVAMIVGLIAIDPIERVTGDTITPLFYLASALLGGNLNLLTIVVGINQLVFSRELKSTSKLRQELEDVQELRRSIAAADGRDVAPTTPAAFLQLLLDSLRAEIESARDAVADTDTATARELRAFCSQLDRELDRAAARLDGRTPKTVDVLTATLAIDFAPANHRARRLRAQHHADLPANAFEALGRSIDHLEQLVLVRNHFESMYTQKSLSGMSRQMLAVGVPAEFLLGTALLWFVGLLGGPGPMTAPLPLIYGLLVVGLAPLALLFAFVVRAATIARKTAITTQFSPQRNAERTPDERTSERG